MFQTTTTPQYTPISPDSHTDLSRFVDIITSAFTTTALTNTFIVEIDNTPPPYPSELITHARRERHFSQGILDSAHSNAELVQAGNWSAIALWEPPNYVGKAFIDSKARPGALLAEWRWKVKAAKEKYLAVPKAQSKAGTDANSRPKSNSTSNGASPSVSSSSSSSSSSGPDSEVGIRRYYHLSFLARNPSVPRVDGAINAVIAPFLQRARDENVPAWLEATMLQAAKVYEHFGFRVVEAINVGKGKVDAMGWPKEGGEGLTAYAMIYDEHLRD